jgi:hypothetical protein
MSTMKVKTVLIVLLAVLVLAPATALAVLQVGDQAPNFTLPDTAWINHQLTEFRGQVVLVNFWQAF